MTTTPTYNEMPSDSEEEEECDTTRQYREEIEEGCPRGFKTEWTSYGFEYIPFQKLYTSEQISEMSNEAFMNAYKQLLLNPLVDAGNCVVSEEEYIARLNGKILTNIQEDWKQACSGFECVKHFRCSGKHQDCEQCQCDKHE